jgi:hypothetical protein
MEGNGMIKYKCVGCNVGIETDDHFGNQVELCPACRAPNRVPLNKEQQKLVTQRQKLFHIAAEERLQREAEKKRVRDEVQRVAEVETMRKAQELTTQKAQELTTQKAAATQEVSKPQRRKSIPVQGQNTTHTLLFLVWVTLVVLAFLPSLGENKYEYLIIFPSDQDVCSKLSDYGSQGWEVVSARRATDEKKQYYAYELIMKKQK